MMRTGQTEEARADSPPHTPLKTPNQGLSLDEALGYSLSSTYEAFIDLLEGLSRRGSTLRDTEAINHVVFGFFLYHPCGRTHRLSLRLSLSLLHPAAPVARLPGAAFCPSD